MRFNVIQKSITEAECDVIIVNLFEGVKKPEGATGAVDKALNGAITALIEREKFEGKIGQIVDLTTCGGVPAARVLIVGLGKQEELDASKIRRASAAAAKRARDLKAAKVATVLHGAGAGGIDTAVAAQSLAEGAILGSYQFIKYKTGEDKPSQIEEISIVEMDGGKTDAINAGIAKAEIIANAVNFSRDLTNEPGNAVTPTYLADQAKAIAADTGLEYQVFERDEIKKMGMGLLFAVAKGSKEEPKFIILKYTSPNATKTVGLVGKGITFDSGGLNLKSGPNMGDMKDDMSGAGVVLATMKAIAALKPNVNVLGVMPATENMPGGDATRPGDVVKGYSGKTVEINNTDAEGRLILADAVAYAEKQGVDQIIDLATLTGACVVALGRQVSGILGDQEIVDNLIKATVGGIDNFWQLPLFPDYDESLKSDIADMKNAPNEAGTITGAFFIKRHVEKTPWVHIDIAGPAFSDKDTPVGPKGGTGAGVYTLINYLMKF